MNEHDEIQAALYAVGALTRAEREAFESGLNPELSKQVAAFQETIANISLADLQGLRKPSPDLKTRVMAAKNQSSFGALAPLTPCGEALVITDRSGKITYINPAFTELCGYTLPEIIGTKPGRMLQGPATSPEAVRNLREAVAEGRPCTQKILNYHKDGTPYWVRISISPIRDPDFEVSGFIALEKKIEEPTPS